MQMYGLSGEPLGVIGQQPGGLPWKLPAWKQDFLAKPSVSVRRGIAWGFQSPCEDTDTLVLTAPSGDFVDIRLPKDARSSQETREHPSFWAFSGHARTTFHDAGNQLHGMDMPYTAHCKFLHEIDSRGLESKLAGDEGDMFLLMNGDCLEVGIMNNPDSGQKELYKEYWHSAEKLLDPDGLDDSNTCIVARVINPPSSQGIIIRLGGRVQGIFSSRQEDDRETIEVERWTRGSSAHARPVQEYNQYVPEGPWSRDVRSSGFLPAGWLCIPGKQVGDTLEYNGVDWKISEIHH